MLKVALTVDAWTAENAWRRMRSDRLSLISSLFVAVVFLGWIAIVVYALVQRNEDALTEHFDIVAVVYPQIVGMVAYFTTARRIHRSLAWCITGWLSSYAWTRQDIFDYCLIRTAMMAGFWLIAGVVVWLLLFAFLDGTAWQGLSWGLAELLASVILAGAIGISFARVGIRVFPNAPRIIGATALLALLVAGSIAYSGVMSFLWLIGKYHWSARFLTMFVAPLVLAAILLAGARLWFVRLPARNLPSANWRANNFMAARPSRCQFGIPELLDRWRVRGASRVMLNARRTNRLLVKHEILFRLVFGVLLLAFVGMPEPDHRTAVLILGVGGGLLAHWVATASSCSLDQLSKLLRPLPVTYSTMLPSCGRLSWLIVAVVAVITATLALPRGLATAGIVGIVVLSIGLTTVTLELLMLLAHSSNELAAKVLFAVMLSLTVLGLFAFGVFGLLLLVAIYWIYANKARKAWNGHSV